MSPRKDNTSRGRWQVIALIGFIAEALGFSFDALDIAQNYNYGLALNWVVAYAYAGCGFGMAFTVSAIGWLHLNWRQIEFWGFGALFAVCLAVTGNASLMSHSARMGGQINSANESAKIAQEAEEALSRALVEETAAATAKAAADRAAASMLAAPSLADVEKEIAQAASVMNGLVTAAKRRGIEEPTDDGVCNRLSLCRQERRKLEALNGKVAPARARDDAQKAAAARQADLDRARQAVESARERLDAARQRGGKRDQSLFDAASISGGDTVETARAAAAHNAQLFTVMSLSIAIVGSFLGGRLLASALAVRAQERPVERPRPQQASKQASKPAGSAQPKNEPKTEAQNAQGGDHVVLNWPGPKKPRDRDRREEAKRFAAQEIAQKGPKIKKAQMQREMEKRFGTSRSTAQRIIAEAIKDAAQEAQNPGAQKFGPAT